MHEWVSVAGYIVGLCGLVVLIVALIYGRREYRVNSKLVNRFHYAPAPNREPSKRADKTAV